MNTKLPPHIGKFLREISEPALPEPTGHPSSDVLVAYAEGRLPTQQIAECDAHLEHCGECLAVIEGLFNELPEPSPDVIAESRESFQRFLHKLTTSEEEPALADTSGLVRRLGQKLASGWQRLAQQVNKIQLSWDEAAEALQRRIALAPFHVGRVRSGGGSTKGGTTVGDFLPAPIFEIRREGDPLLLEVFAHETRGDLKFKLTLVTDGEIPLAVVISTPTWEVRAPLDSKTRSAEVVMPGTKLLDWKDLRFQIELKTPS